MLLAVMSPQWWCWLRWSAAVGSRRRGEGKVVPAEGKVEPAEGKVVPAEGKVVHAEGRICLAEGRLAQGGTRPD